MPEAARESTDAAPADRLAAADAQRDLAASTDVDGWALAEGSPHRG